MLKTPPLTAQDFVIALDERGKELTSTEFARLLAQVRVWQQIAQLWVVVPGGLQGSDCSLDSA